MPIVPDPNKTLSFPDASSFERWLGQNHDRETELWLKVHKKGSGLPTVSYAEALDVALCWGWIDGLKKSFDQLSFLQRFTPRKAKSVWSQINREHVARLEREGRMTAHGRKHVDAAKQDGRWDNAYAGQSKMELPADLLAAIAKNAKAAATFASLSKVSRFAMAFRLNSLKTEAGRKKRIAAFVEGLAKGEAPHHEKPQAQ
jgi:uncharacterized protein YdeI (YjbR/CyaY-like superfamily)